MQNSNSYSEINKRELMEKYDNNAEKTLEHLEGFYSMDVSSLDMFSPATKYFYNRKIIEMIKLSGIKKGSHILEVGCNYGLITFILAGMGYKVTAVDLSPKSIELAEKIKKIKSVRNAIFYVADAENLNQFPENHFDTVISFSVLRYVPSPQKALREIYRVVKRNGTAVIDFPNRYCPWFRLIRAILGMEEHMHDHLYSPEEIKEMFIKAGFKDVKTKLFLYTYRKSPSLLLFISRHIGEILERIPIVNRTAAIIMCGGVKT